MGTKADALADRFEAFNREVMDLVFACTPEQWRIVLPYEEWSVGVTARHIGAGHFSARELAGAILRGDPLPELTMDAVIDMGNAHAREHSDCTRDEVLAVLKTNGEALSVFVRGLDDDDLAKTAHLALMGGDVGAGKLMEFIILESAGEHLANMRKALQA
jgi:hypothetical protein